MGIIKAHGHPEILHLNLRFVIGQTNARKVELPGPLPCFCLSGFLGSDMPCTLCVFKVYVDLEKRVHQGKPVGRAFI